MASASERRAAAAQHELESLRDSVATLQRQLADTEAQLAALRGAPGARTTNSTCCFASSTPTMRGTPGMAFGLGPCVAPAMEHSGFLGGPMGHSAGHHQLAAIMQLQAETERLQVTDLSLALFPGCASLCLMGGT